MWDFCLKKITHFFSSDSHWIIYTRLKKQNKFYLLLFLFIFFTQNKETMNIWLQIFLVLDAKQRCQFFPSPIRVGAVCLHSKYRLVSTAFKVWCIHIFYRSVVHFAYLKGLLYWLLSDASDAFVGKGFVSLWERNLSISSSLSSSSSSSSSYSTYSSTASQVLFWGDMKFLHS